MDEDTMPKPMLVSASSLIWRIGSDELADYFLPNDDVCMMTNLVANRSMIIDRKRPPRFISSPLDLEM